MAKEDALEQEEETEEQEPVAEESVAQEEPKPLSDDLKVVITIYGGKVLLGVQSPDCDPQYTTFEGTLPAALKRVPKFVAEAREKWTASRRNPKANLPKPEPRQAPARTPAPAKKETAQPSFF